MKKLLTVCIIWGLGLILVLGLSGCVTTQAVRLGASSQPLVEIPWKQVSVYRTADQIPGKYEEIALLSSTGDALDTSEEDMWNSMKKKAGKLGGNAIILDAMNEPSAGAKLASAFFLANAMYFGGADRKGKAIVIYVFPEK